MKEWNNDKELFAIVRSELYTAVVGDIMDKMGYTKQFLSPRLKPLREGMFLVGRAMTVLEADTFCESSSSRCCRPSRSRRRRRSSGRAGRRRWSPR